MLEIPHMIKIIMLPFLKSVLCLKYSIQLFCCWYHCCVQTFTFQSLFTWCNSGISYQFFFVFTRRKKHI